VIGQLTLQAALQAEATCFAVGGFATFPGSSRWVVGSKIQSDIHIAMPKNRAQRLAIASDDLDAESNF